jgi:hypothetical protein
MASVTKLTVLLFLLAAGGCGGSGDDPPNEGDAGCGMPFTEYSAGASVAGIEFEARVTNCGKRPFVGYIYGTCHATSDTGCAPPLEVQTWSACHRRPSLLGGARLGLRRGETTIVIFARSKRLARKAAVGLRKARQADPKLPATERLRACGAR